MGWTKLKGSLGREVFANVKYQGRVGLYFVYCTQSYPVLQEGDSVIQTCDYKATR